ncbi:uncharacterized protein [Epargyreus clarus]|uniref:uncharacterized protein n=1 Tax=Epargyreus clarus TaxID=520877 RepID=UPI003C2E659F
MTSRITLEQADIDTLIAEVHKRPAIWNKSIEEYSSKLLKLRFWDEICEEMVQNWSELTSKKKKNISTELQKKWRNLKDAFNKELAIQRKNDETGQGGKKKRLYIHFEALSFLESQYPKKRNSNKDTSSNVSHDSDSSSSEQEIMYAPKRKEIIQYIDTNNLEMPTETQHLHQRYDEDVSFTEMLIPMLKKLSDDQKLYARIEILQILNNAKNYCPPDVKP